ncbi:transcription antitermination factor NusB [Parenemella sanctibonifatiensis]|uniref:Transcription antitermination protein NusB n=1 Tax=Parenemella sanctibonifatiensis TaxID=2016505 RepID=A0A255EHP5_9ACTN|nr:transcription antitermination factor NusB [Parenemella sanctibonifatiensis]OYN86515.1 transcription antitermination factor NusB [Parenemella sanctibonifatiensis]OYN91049.1 transcription antitermination factor NusB [Parenemella sanctibonifatiensis]
MAEQAPEPTQAPRPHTTTRQKARKRAVDIIFEADLRERDLRATLLERAEQAEPAVREFTAALVGGVADHLAEVDDQIRQVLPAGWTLERMPRVDRSIARLATYELSHTDTDTNIVLAEATRLTGELSGDESVRFVNGVTAAVAKHRG